MKKLIVILVILFNISLAAHAQSAGATTTVQFSVTLIDYGTINQGADGARSFTLTNTGENPLYIYNVIAPWGCTASWPSEAIAPGANTTITIHYDTRVTGAFEMDIFFHSNAGSEKKLKIKGVVN